MDIPQELSEITSSSLEDLSQAIVLSSSPPPSQQLESSSLYQETQLQPNLDSITNSSNGCGLLDNLDVKLEECQAGFNDYFASYRKLGRGLLFRPRFDTFFEPPNYQTRALCSPEDHSGHLRRRVYSAGDLQDIRPARTSTQWSLTNSNHLTMEEEGNLKVGQYSAEERIERISKYRAKRNQRNFTKTIKYACRKTLADNRTRVRGRFARNDETSEIIPKVASSAIDEHEESWFEGHEDEDNGAMVAGGGGGVRLVSSYVNPHFHHYYGY